MSTLVPYLTFHDGDASLRFLTEGLGFEMVTQQRGDDGSVVHAELRRGDAIVMGGAGDVTPTAAPGIYVVVAGADDVDAIVERAVPAGGTVVLPPESTEWGARRARLTDPDGHEWTVGTYQPGQSW